MMKLVIFLIDTILCWGALSTPTADDLVITLPDGRIQGAKYLTPNNKTYYGFRGIPFATPPLEKLRFEIPQPPKPWSDVLDGTTDRKGCVSTDYPVNPDGESEDCLYINVYTPSLKPTEKLPVMFWIYGGGFVSGSGSKSIYGPDFLIEEDVIVVTFNYRLGPFGFLSTADLALQGNAGLKDQNLALKWTNDNIALFGGDPDKITIFGESAGGISASHHILSEKSAGLFRAAILESGSSTQVGAIHLDPRSYAFLLADAIPGGNYGNDTQKLKEFLLGKTALEIINAALSLPKGVQVSTVMETEDENAFLTKSPYQTLQSGNFNQVPIMIGICAEESLMFLADLENTKQIATLYDTFPSYIIPTDLRPNSTDENAVIEKIKNNYLKGSQLFSEDFVGLAKYYSDNIIGRGAIKYAELSSKYVPAYLYQFSYYGRAITPAFIDGAEKASHTAELPFLFYISPLYDQNPANLLTQNRMTKLWANFAKFLNPTPEKSELLNNVLWSKISPTNRTYLNINETLEIKYHFEAKTYPIWNEIYDNYGKKPFITF